MQNGTILVKPSFEIEKIQKFDRETFSLNIHMKQTELKCVSEYHREFVYNQNNDENLKQ
jgi:hypothetical protein